MATQHNLTHGGSGNERIDPSTGTVVHVVGSRQIVQICPPPIARFAWVD